MASLRAIRRCLISMLPPAACISRKRAAQDLGERSVKPRSTASPSACIGSARSGCSVGAVAAVKRNSASITGWLRGEPATTRPWNSAVFGAEQQFPGVCGRAGAAGPVEVRPVEHERHAVRIGRQPAHAHLRPRPIGDEARRLARFEQAERPGDVAHQQGRTVDPGRERHVLCLDGKRRMVAVDLSFRVGAMHLDAQRKSADRLRPTGIDAARGSFPLDPAGQGPVRDRRRNSTSPRPSRGRARRQSPPARLSATAAGAAQGGGGRLGLAGHRRRGRSLCSRWREGRIMLRGDSPGIVPVSRAQCGVSKTRPVPSAVLIAIQANRKSGR